MYNRQLEAKQAAVKKGELTVLEGYKASQRKKAADRHSDLAGRSDALHEAAASRFRSKVGVKTGTRHG